MPATYAIRQVQPARPWRLFFAAFAVKIFNSLDKAKKILTAKAARNFREVRKEINHETRPHT